jgi:hypothetical protein
MGAVQWQRRSERAIRRFASNWQRMANRNIDDADVPVLRGFNSLRFRGLAYGCRFTGVTPRTIMRSAFSSRRKLLAPVIPTD